MEFPVGGVGVAADTGTAVGERRADGGGRESERGGGGGGGSGQGRERGKQVMTMTMTIAWRVLAHGRWLGLLIGKQSEEDIWD